MSPALTLADTRSTIEARLPDGMMFNNGDHIDHNKVGLMQPTPKDASLEEMRRTMKESGYVFIKDLIPRGDVLRVRERRVSSLDTAFCCVED